VRAAPFETEIGKLYVKRHITPDRLPGAFPTFFPHPAGNSLPKLFHFLQTPPLRTFTTALEDFPAFKFAHPGEPTACFSPADSFCSNSPSEVSPLTLIIPLVNRLSPGTVLPYLLMARMRPFPISAAPFLSPSLFIFFFLSFFLLLALYSFFSGRRDRNFSISSEGPPLR